MINGGIDATEKEGPAGGSEEHNANELAAAHTELEHKKELNHTMLPGSSALPHFSAQFAKFITVAHCVYMKRESALQSS